MTKKRYSRLRMKHASPLPLGVIPLTGGVRFSLFSRSAKSVSILLFDNPEDLKPAKTLKLDHKKHRFGDIWSVFIEGIGNSQLYAYSIEPKGRDGFMNKGSGHLIDPYAKAVTGPYNWHLERFPGPKVPEVPKSMVVSSRFSWKSDSPIHVPWSDTIIYEVHLRGFTKHPSSKVQNPGTFDGFMQKIPYLKELGVTTIEFLPLQAFPENENINVNPITGERLTNYWGYSTMAFMALHAPYAANKTPGGEIEEFKKLVKELHNNGMEVIMDVVFNHTAEGNETGPWLSFRGIENEVYYILEDEYPKYKNFSGCGNTFNCNHPVVRDFILDVLRYWVVELHVDGFRFDLASILGRDQNGALLDNPPLVERISEDPILRGVKIIAEAWDAGGAYQVGSFPGTRWAEWNGRYRDDIRRFWLKDGDIKALATRIAGSEDLYGRSDRTPLHSINFVTCHDGFSLRDLVSYNNKHNEANGENNRDGENHNISNNCGVEGETWNPDIRKQRLIQMKNLLATLIFSQGIPMISSGDEVGHTKKGNNNTYCQNNPLSWMDWRLQTINGFSKSDFSVKGYSDPSDDDINDGISINECIKHYIAIRKRFPHFSRRGFFKGEPVVNGGYPDVSWLDENGTPVDWSRSDKILSVLLGQVENSDSSLLMLFNGEPREVNFKIPHFKNNQFELIIDTTLETKSMAEDKIVSDNYNLAGPGFALIKLHP